MPFGEPVIQNEIAHQLCALVVPFANRPEQGYCGCGSMQRMMAARGTHPTSAWAYNWPTVADLNTPESLHAH